MNTPRSKIKGKNITRGEKDTPATVGIVYEIRDHLDHKIEAVDHKIEGVRHELMAAIHQVKEIVHSGLVLMEAQRADNKIVLDGIKMLSDRQDRVEVRMDEMGQTIRRLAAAGSRRSES